MWSEIITNQDIKCFLENIDHFVDSCIKEMRYVSGSYAQDKKSLYAVNDQRDLYIIFDSISNYLDPGKCDSDTDGLQAARVSFEVKFSGIHRLILEPYLDNCDSVIYDAALIRRDGLFYWYDYKEENISDFTPKGTMVIAEKMSWRFINESASR